MIVASAIIVTQPGKKPILAEGYRHSYCFEKIYDMGIRRPFEEKQGFITDNGVFMDRETAFIYAVDCGQTKRKYTQGALLYSEDLW